MKIECPKCHKMNNVAGAYTRKDTSSEGKSRVVLYCGFCGERFSGPIEDSTGKSNASNQQTGNS